MKKVKQLCLGISILIGLGSLPVTGFASGVPTVDGVVASLETQEVIQQMAEYVTQLEQYYVQLEELALQGEQYADQVKNTLSPAVYIWDQVDKTLAEIAVLQSRLDYYYSKVENGDIDSYTDRMKDVNYWKGSEWSRTTNNEDIFKHYDDLNNAEFAANMDLMATAQYYKESAGYDAAQLIKLQQAAEAAGGRMEAIQSTNQLMANQTQLLIEIKNLMAIQAAATAQNLNTQQQQEAKRLVTEQGVFVNWQPHVEEDMLVMDAFK